MYVTVVFLSVLLARSLSGLILPLTKPDGTADMSSLLNHVSLLEQTVSSLQATTMQVQTELQVTKKDLQTTQSQLQTAMNDLQTSKTQQLSSAAEIPSLKDEVISMKAELRVSLHELITVKTQLENMTQGDSHANDLLNLTLLNTISHDVKLNTAQVNAVRLDVKMLDKQLKLVNATLFNGERETHSFIQNVSSVIQSIRHEQLVETMELQSTKVLAQTATKQLDKLENDVNSTSSVVCDVTQHIQSARADLHMVQTNLTVATSEVSTLKRYMSDVEKQSLDNKQSLTQALQMLTSKTRNVAFQAQMKTSDLASDVPLTFNTMLFNSGSAYNSTTGKFTAPVNGSYMFWTQLELNKPNANMYVRMLKSGSVQIAAGYVSTYSHIFDATASGVGVTHLDKGEEVWVQISHPQNIFYEASYFGGALLCAD